MIKKREIDIFGVLLGVGIGCILGFFLSTRINLNSPVDDDSEVTGQAGNIYLLQIDKFEDPEDALALLEEISSDGLYAISVLDNDKYYIYGAISNNSEGLTIIADEFTGKGYTPIEKREYIIDKPNSVIEDEFDYGFWTEAIDNLFNSLEGEAIVISEEYDVDPVNIDMYTNMLALKTIKNENLKNEFRLHSYKIIVETLG